MYWPYKHNLAKCLLSCFRGFCASITLCYCYEVVMNIVKVTKKKHIKTYQILFFFVFLDEKSFSWLAVDNRISYLLYEGV